MRRNWTADEYRVGRWLSPTLAFSWASIVGLSRIHADEHFLTDVLAGALVGALMAELYYKLAYESVENSAVAELSGPRTTAFAVRFSF
jgi:membrane-associated phospholipid phosphatase